MDHGIRINPAGRVENHTADNFLKHPIDYANVEVHMLIEAEAEPVNEGDCADVQRRLIHTCRTGAVGLQSLRDDPQEDAQHHVEHRPVALHEVAQPFGYRQHPLAHRQAGKNMIRQVCRRLYHAPGVARGAHATAFAGEGHEVVVATIIATGAGKAVGKDAAFEAFAKRLAHIALWRVVVTLSVELPHTGEIEPSLEVFGYRLVQQRALRVVWVVEFGFARCCK
jgi:hypothetical protein